MKIKATPSFRTNFKFMTLFFMLFSGSPYLFSQDKAKPSKKKETIKVAFVNVLEDGKKVWVVHPKSVPSGHPLSITVVNTMNEPHGLTMEGFIQRTEILPNEVKTFSVKGSAVKKGSHPITCHMHPPHVGTNLTVK